MFIKMKTRLSVLVTLMLPIFIHAQEKELRPIAEVVVIPQELNDHYKSLQGNLTGSDGRVNKIKETRQEIQKFFPSSKDAPDLGAVLSDLDRQEQAVEASRKIWKDELSDVEAKIKEFIVNAHGKPVEWRTYNPNPVEKLGTVITTTYSLQDGHVIASDVYFQLPGPAEH